MRSRPAVLAVVAGLAVIALAQLGAPRGSPPLYDGVVIQDPYRDLVPGRGAGPPPSSFRSSLKVEGSKSPQFVAATSENPPQAQLIAPADAFALRPGTTALSVSIAPVPAPPPLADRQIVGNVYRFSVVDEAGAALAVGQTMAPTLLLRAPAGVLSATISRFAHGNWQALPTQPSGQPGIFLTNVSELGDFAIIASASPGPLGLEPGLVVAGVALSVLSALLLGGLLARGRRSAAAPRPAAPRQTPPTKRPRGGRGRDSLR